MTASPTTIQRPAGRSPAPAFAKGANRLFGPLAGTRLLPLYGVVTHHGRRSGTEYRTPVVARRVSDGFVIPMPWGEQTDWYRNVRAAGGCTIRWKGRDFRVVTPELIVPAAEAPGFGAFQRWAIGRLNIATALHLRDAPANG